LLLRFLQKHAAFGGVSHKPGDFYSHSQAKTVFAADKEKAMKAFDHMLQSHLDAFPRAYALSAKQKQVYRQHQRRYWAALRNAVARQLQKLWTRWVAPARCDKLIERFRHQYRVHLA
jgi:hypothetical protein